MRERRAFLIPVCPPLWKTEKDAGCTCSGSARSREDRCAGPLRPRVDGLGGGEQALRGHRGLHVEEKAAAIVGFRAPQGAGWTLRVTSSSMVPRPPSGCSWAAVLAGPVGARLRERADVVGRYRAVRSARPVGGRGRGAGRREIGAAAWREISKRRASALRPSFISRMRLHGRNRQRSSTRRRHVGRGARQECFGSPDRCPPCWLLTGVAPGIRRGRSLVADNCQRCQRLRPA